MGRRMKGNRNNFDLIRLYAASEVMLMHGLSHFNLVDTGNLFHTSA